MTAWWITQSLLMGAWLAAAAWGLDGSWRRIGRPTRLAWWGGLVALVALTAWVVVRPTLPPALAMVWRAPLTPAPVQMSAQAPSPWQQLWSAPAQLMERAGARATQWEHARGLGPWLAGGWALASGLTALGLLALHMRMAWRRRGWTMLGSADGIPVRRSTTEGPCVVGLPSSEIVLPAWAAALPEAERALIVAHEREHVRGGDPWLLATANLALVAVPWHPLAWWMHARLRLAIELDCDRRCLAATSDVGTYGRLLLTAAGHTQSRLPWRAVAPAFATRRSHLERRLLAMTRVPRPRRAEAVAATAVALVATLAACESATPTAAQVAAADAASVQAALLPTLKDSNVTYVVNGQVVRAEEAKRVQAKDIKTIAVVSRTNGAQIRLDVARTAVPGEAAPTMDADPMRAVTAATQSPLIVLDGVVQTSPAAWERLPAERIASVEIVKGAAARALYDVSVHPNAANGVVQVRTKP